MNHTKKRHLRAVFAMFLALCMTAGSLTPAPLQVYAAEDEDAGSTSDTTVEGEDTQTEEHHFTDYVYNNDATCTEDGTETATCNDEDCTETDTRVKEGTALGHSFANDADHASWNWSRDQSYATLKLVCTRDESHVITTEKIIPTEKITEEPTCTEDGNVDLIVSYIVNEGTDDEIVFTDSRSAIAEALGHDYKVSSWDWSDDYSVATAHLVCGRDSSHTENREVVTSSDIIAEPTCTETGTKIYTASITLNEDDDPVTDTKEVTLDATGHDLYVADWDWNSSFTEADAEIVCRNDSSHNYSTPAVVTSETTAVTCTEDGKIIHTATVTLNDVTYTDTKEEVTETATGHNYKLNGFVWTEDHSGAYATFTCQNDSSHVQNVDATITSSNNLSDCEEDYITYYTASVEFEGTTYDDTQMVATAAPGHDYAEPVYTWTGSDDSQTEACQIALTCNRCGETKTQNCTIKSVENEQTETSHSNITYTATAVVDGQTYTDTKVVFTSEHQTSDAVIEAAEEGGYDSVVYCSVCGEEMSRTHITFTISFDANEGKGAMDSMTLEYGVTTALPACAFTKTGYHFGGWYVARADGTIAAVVDGVSGWYTEEELRSLSVDGAYFDAGADASVLTDVPGDELTLYPKWVRNTYKVKFKANGGSGIIPETMTVSYGVSSKLSVNTFTRTGYTFQGWYAYRKSDKKWYAYNVDGKKGWYTAEQIDVGGYTKVLFKDQAKVAKSTGVDGDTIVMYAHWKINTYTVAFNKNGGKGSMSSLKVKYGKKPTLTANAYTRSGYTFAGWWAYRKSDEKFYAKNTDGKKGWYTAAVIKKYGYSYITFKDQATLPVMSDAAGDKIVMYAQWTK